MPTNGGRAANVQVNEKAGADSCYAEMKARNPKMSCHQCEK